MLTGGADVGTSGCLWYRLFHRWRMPPVDMISCAIAAAG